MVNQSFLLARMRLIGLNTPLRVVTHWCGNSILQYKKTIISINLKQKRRLQKIQTPLSLKL